MGCLRSEDHLQARGRSSCVYEYVGSDPMHVYYAAKTNIVPLQPPLPAGLIPMQTRRVESTISHLPITDIRSLSLSTSICTLPVKQYNMSQQGPPADAKQAQAAALAEIEAAQRRKRAIDTQLVSSWDVSSQSFFPSCDSYCVRPILRSRYIASKEATSKRRLLPEVTSSRYALRTTRAHSESRFHDY